MGDPIPPGLPSPGMSGTATPMGALPLPMPPSEEGEGRREREQKEVTRQLEQHRRQQEEKERQEAEEEEFQREQAKLTKELQARAAQMEKQAQQQYEQQRLASAASQERAATMERKAQLEFEQQRLSDLTKSEAQQRQARQEAQAAAAKQEAQHRHAAQEAQIRQAHEAERQAAAGQGQKWQDQAAEEETKQQPYTFSVSAPSSTQQSPPATASSAVPHTNRNFSAMQTVGGQALSSVEASIDGELAMGLTPRDYNPDSVQTGPDSRVVLKLSQRDDAMKQMIEALGRDEYSQMLDDYTDSTGGQLSARALNGGEDDLTGGSLTARALGNSSMDYPDSPGIFLSESGSTTPLPMPLLPEDRFYSKSVTVPEQHNMAGGANNSTSALISALQLKVAQLETVVSSKDAELHLMRRGQGDALVQDFHEEREMEALEESILSTARGDSASRRIDYRTGSTLSDSSKLLTAGSLGSNILSQLSPSTLIGMKSPGTSGVISLKQHHEILATLTVRFDRALNTATEEADLMKRKVEKLEKELTTITLHADTLAIEAETLLARDSQLQLLITGLRSTGEDLSKKYEATSTELEALKQEFEAMQIRDEALTKQNNLFKEQNDSLTFSLQQTHELLDSMTQKRDEEIFLRNQFKLKFQMLEAEYEKVERIWEEHQKDVVARAQDPTDAAMHGGSGMNTGRSYSMEFAAEVMTARGVQQQQQEEKTPDGSGLLSPSGQVTQRGGMNVLSSTSTHPNHWLQQHELQHLYHKGEKKKLKKEIRELAQMSDMWKENYETLQKLHYSMVDELEAKGVKGMSLHGLSSGSNTARGVSLGSITARPEPDPVDVDSRPRAIPIGPDVEQIRLEVRKLVYFLAKRPRQEKASFTAPLLPPMPASLPMLFKDAWICLEESLADLSTKLESRTLEVNNLNDMLQLMMEPAYAMDWTTGGMTSVAKDQSSSSSSDGLTPQQRLMLEGLSLDLQFKEEELINLTAQLQEAREEASTARRTCMEEISAARSEKDQTIAKITQEARDTIAKITDESAAQVAAIRSEAVRQVSDLQSSHDRSLSFLRSDYEKRLSDSLSQSAQALKLQQESSDRRIQEAQDLQRHWEALLNQRTLDLQSEHRTELEELRLRYVKERQESEAMRSKMFQDILKKDEAEVQAVRQANRAALEQQVQSHASRVAALAEKHHVEISHLRADIVELRKGNSERIENLMREYEQERAQLRARVRPTRLVQIADGGKGSSSADDSYGSASSPFSNVVSVRFHESASSESADKPFVSSTLALLAPGAQLMPLGGSGSSVGGWSSASNLLLADTQKELDAALAKLQVSEDQRRSLESELELLKLQLSSSASDLHSTQLRIVELSSAVADSQRLLAIQTSEAEARETRWQAEVRASSDRASLTMHVFNRLLTLLRAELSKPVGALADWRTLGEWIVRAHGTLQNKLNGAPLPSEHFTGVSPQPASAVVLEPYEDSQTRQKLAQEQRFLAEQQQDFQAYLGAQHAALDSRLKDIQTAEELILAKDREILTEVEILNQKIQEYNRKAQELNARTEELKRKRAEIREERLAWNKYKSGAGASSSTGATGQHFDFAAPLSPTTPRTYDALSTTRDDPMSSPLSPLATMNKSHVASPVASLTPARLEQQSTTPQGGQSRFVTFHAT
jgi:hypothetical protein